MQRGQRLGREDPVVPWPTPLRPAWMDEATSAVFPATVAMRELRVQGMQPAFRTRVGRVATTVSDAKAFTKEERAGLSRARWHAQLELRSLKQTRQMAGRRCKTPAMVRQESWGHWLVDNLLRAAMAQAALRQGGVPRHVSLQGARQTLEAFRRALEQASSTRREGILPMVLTAMARHRVGARPDRDEPRVCKRRPKPSPLLRGPRQQARARLATAA